MVEWPSFDGDETMPVDETVVVPDEIAERMIMVVKLLNAVYAENESFIKRMLLNQIKRLFLDGTMTIIIKHNKNDGQLDAALVEMDSHVDGVIDAIFNRLTTFTA